MIVLINILKWIGIVVAVLLGIVLLILLLALFYPFYYSIEINDFDVKIHVTYLLGLINAKFENINHDISYRVRIAWKTILSKEDENDAEKEKNETIQKDKTAKDYAQENELEQDKDSEEQECKDSESYNKITESSDERNQFSENSRKEDNNRKKNDKSSSQNKRSSKIGDKNVKSIFEKIKRNIVGFIKSIAEKISYLKEAFGNYTDECAMKAYSLVLGQLVVILKAIRPRWGKLVFSAGFADPSYTGYALALYSMLYPKVGKRLVFEPKFESDGYEGHGKVKGILQLYVVVIVAGKLYFNKNMKKFLERR